MGCGSSKQPAVSQEAMNVDADNDGLISKEELASFIARNAKLYSMLSVTLNLSEEKCRSIATNVAFQMSKNTTAGGALEGSLRDMSAAMKLREPTIEEFQAFLDFLDNPKGQEEFFQRTVFATYDLDESGYLEPNELDKFLDVFYEAGSIFAGDMRLPKKSKLKKEVMRQLDTNNDGKLEFAELRTLISGGARAGLQFEEKEEEPVKKKKKTPSSSASTASKKKKKKKSTTKKKTEQATS